VLSRDSAPAHLSVLGVVLAVLVAALALGRHRQRVPSAGWVLSGARAARGWRGQPPAVVLSVVVWTVLVVATVGWDLTSFAAQSHSLPTLSYYIGHITRYEAGRGAIFALWLLAGAYLVTAGRTLHRGPR